MAAVSAEDALAVIRMAVQLVLERWERSGQGAWVEGDPTGWRRRFCVSSAIVYAAHWLRANDATRAAVIAVVERVTEDERPFDPKTKERKPLHWWNAQQPDEWRVATALFLAGDVIMAEGVA